MTQILFIIFVALLHAAVVQCNGTSLHNITALIQTAFTAQPNQRIKRETVDGAAAPDTTASYACTPWSQCSATCGTGK
jgi:hypothetical protein